MFIFRQEAQLTQIVLENRLISIQYNMFRDCSDLENVWNLKQLCFVAQHEASPLNSYSILTLKPT